MHAKGHYGAALLGTPPLSAVGLAWIVGSAVGASLCERNEWDAGGATTY